MTRRDYPAHWSALRLAVLARAGQACECRGECDQVHDRPVAGRCAAPQHAWIVRDASAPARWQEETRQTHGAVQIVLTTAHLCQDATCDDLTHLRSYCQRCHLRYDRQQHLANAARTRLRQREAAGQLRLWEG